MKLLQIFLKICIALGTIILVGTLFGAYFFVFELFLHFYLQLFFIGVVLFSGSLFIKEKLYRIVSTMLLIFLGFHVVPVLLEVQDDLEKVDMYYINANYHTDNAGAIVEDIEKFDPKYVAVVELSPNLEKLLLNEYGVENSVVHREGVLSYGVFSRESIQYHQKLRGEHYPFLHVRINHGDFYLIHPLPPMNYDLAEAQKRHFLELENTLNANPTSKKFIIGDFNSSSYSKVFQGYFSEMNYKTLYTWQRGNIFSIPIDYVLGQTDSFRVQVSDLKVSDHSPLLIEFR